MNHFEEFNIPVLFFPDLNTVRNAYYALSRLYHPDLKGDDSKSSQEELLIKSGNLNNAYRILGHFEERVAYVLKLKGVLGEDEKASVPPAFLMDMMDINESLMEAKLEFDTERLQSIKKEAEMLQQELTKDWEQRCREYDTTQENSLLELIKEDYLKNKYLLRLSEQVQESA